jgi:hypothetical protein
MLRRLFECRRQRQTCRSASSAKGSTSSTRIPRWSASRSCRRRNGWRAPGSRRHDCASPADRPGHRPAGHGQRHRRRQRQRTGTGDDQHRNRDPQRLCGIDEPPDDRHRRRQKQQLMMKRLAMRSASSTMRGFSVAARSIRRTIADSRVASPTCTTSTSSGLSTLTAPPITERSRALADRRTFTGEQRLVGAALAFDHPPVRRNRLAGLTSTTSPGCRSAAITCSRSRFAG